MEELVNNHLQIMNRFDPEHKVGLIVDEWGTWYDVEPGTNPGFLYQQNTMRDAIVAAVNLNIFNEHSDRIVMANIAQMVNVLQAVILTEGNRMVLTPTYHVFDLYKDHQDATLVESYLDTEKIGVAEEHQVPNLSASVSEDANGVLHITAANLSADKAYPLECEIVGRGAVSAEALILAGSMDTYNDFTQGNRVGVEAFDGVSCMGNRISFEIPACSVMKITVR